MNTHDAQHDARPSSQPAAESAFVIDTPARFPDFFRVDVARGPIVESDRVASFYGSTAEEATGLAQEFVSARSGAESAKRLRSQLEQMVCAEQCADLLLGDIRSAYRLACVENPTAVDRLLDCALLPLISDACALRDKLNGLRLALEVGR